MYGIFIKTVVMKGRVLSDRISSVLDSDNRRPSYTTGNDNRKFTKVTETAIIKK